MEAKHTPGPWRAAEMGVIADLCTSHGNFYVCSLIDPDNAEDKANARLIAAAPEILEALRDCVLWLESHRPLEANKKSDQARNCLNQARAVIAKAEGRES